MESKNLLKAIEADITMFKTLSDKWASDEDKAACAKSRAYAKRLMKALKAYVSASISDEALVKPKQVAKVVKEEVKEEVKEVVTEKPVKKEVVEKPKEKKPENKSDFSSWYSKRY